MAIRVLGFSAPPQKTGECVERFSQEEGEQRAQTSGWSSPPAMEIGPPIHALWFVFSVKGYAATHGEKIKKNHRKGAERNGPDGEPKKTDWRSRRTPPLSSVLHQVLRPAGREGLSTWKSRQGGELGQGNSHGRIRGSFHQGNYLLSTKRRGAIGKGFFQVHGIWGKGENGQSTLGSSVFIL